MPKRLKPTPAITTTTTTTTAAAAATIPRSSAPRLAPLPPAHSVKILSWNVNGLRSALEKAEHGLVPIFNHHDADLVFLQETKLQAASAAKLTSAFPGFEVHFSCSSGKKGYAGTALLVRNEFKPRVRRITFGLGTEPIVGHDEGRSIIVELDAFYFVGLYTINSGRELERLETRINDWDRVVRSHIADLSKTKPVVLGGDLNVCHLDADIWNPDAKHIPKQAGCTPQERQSFDKFLREDHVVDAWRALHPEATGWFTYWSQRANGWAPNKGLRLDYFVVPEGMMDKSNRPHVHDCWIDPKPPRLSDHGPIVIELAV